MVGPMDADQMKLLYPKERETDTNPWISYTVFPSEGARVIEGHLDTYAYVNPQYAHGGV